jgi:ParB family chromosome partitioning protein
MDWANSPHPSPRTGLQPLLVVAREDGRYEVVAGGRRLAAFKLLAKAKTLPRNHSVPVLVREVGAEESLAENMVRVALHPADQYEAFRRLELGGLGSTDIAARFGVSQRVVRQRLALGAVSPAQMQAYREGELTLAQLEAFTLTTMLGRSRRFMGWSSTAISLLRRRQFGL